MIYRETEREAQKLHVSRHHKIIIESQKEYGVR
jgi:hypothetical protein